MHHSRRLLSGALGALACTAALARAVCKYRSDVDPRYCDGNKHRGAIERKMACAEAAATK